MIAADIQLAIAACAGVALVVLMILKGRMHAFIALLCGALAVGLLAGLSVPDTTKAMQKGVGDIMGGTGLVVALGLSLGAMLHISNGAASLARSVMGIISPRAAPWASLAAGMLIGLPLFFETGLVLLLPVVIALNLPSGGTSAGTSAGKGKQIKLQTILCALAGLSVVHALVPPHPGPLLAVEALGADVGRTMLFGLLIAIPTGIVAGPLLARVTTRNVAFVSEPAPEMAATSAPPLWASLMVMLVPVILIASGELGKLLPGANLPLGWLGILGTPVIALLIANIVALPLLFGRQLFDPNKQSAIWTETMRDAGTIILTIGAGGALKQVMVSAGLPGLLIKLFEASGGSPLLVGWLIAVGIRLATGSATVATITTVGIMSGTLTGTDVSPEWMVLAIGAGSVFFSHVNDPGFWLVKSYTGMSMTDTFRTWSALETVISVMGIVLILIASQFLP